VVRDEVSLNLVKCGMCGKATVVQAGHRSVCEACRVEEQKLYARVRTLLREYDGSKLTIQDVAEMLKEDEKKITHLVDSGYFKLVMSGIRPNEW
jgi:hypothetical protein